MRKKLLRLTTIIVAFLLAFNISAISGSAILVVNDGDYSFVYNSDDTLSVYSYSGTDVEVSLPSKAMGEKVTSVSPECFKNSNIVSVSIPSSYTEIGAAAFKNCASLTGITLSKNIKSIGDDAFSECNSLVTADLSGSKELVKIPKRAFYGDVKLSTLLLPENVEKIEAYALQETSITDFSAPTSLVSIENSAFYGCDNLKSVFLGEGVENIGDSVFENCTNLESVDLPVSLLRIGMNAFKNDNLLEDVFLSQRITNIGADAFFPMSYRKTIKADCFINTYAYTYCYENFVETNPIVLKKGDSSFDGNLDVLDASCIQRFCIGTYELKNAGARKLSDVNNDGKITVRDATLIQMKLAKYDVGF